MIRISKRLKLITTYITDNEIVADIGCDHGYLDIYLAQKYKNIKLIASDINEKALTNAVSNIKKYGLEQRIETRISDGLMNINENFTTIVLSGLGSRKIVDILVNSKAKIQGINQLIVQSNSDLNYLRKNVVKLGFYIFDEDIVKENNILYTVIVFRKGKKKYSIKEYYFGPILLKNNSLLFQEKKQLDYKKLQLKEKLIPKKYIIKRLKIKLESMLYL
ncbi:MAG: class I SAM-dependent methyltransferase [bacterium]|nr:class I SAM-dependent methyltransferase [bacterium]